MDILTLIALLPLAFLLYSAPEMLKNLLPSWWTTGGDTTDDAPREHQDAQTHHVATTQEEPEADSTPKAPAEKTADDEVPTFTLSDSDAPPQETPSTADAEPRPATFPAPNSAQRASSAMPPPPPPPKKPNIPKNDGRMQPPARPTSQPAAAAAAAAATSLRLPGTGPLPNRGPPAGSQQRVNASARGGGKVVLKPGHSPLDWAALTRKGNLSGVESFQRVTPSQLRTMTGRKGKAAWSSWQGKVYNITPYLPFHPGGEAELMKAAGRDGTKLFMDVHPWVNWENMLGVCLVGVLVPEDYA